MKFTAVKFRMMSITSEVLMTSKNTTIVAKKPWNIRSVHEKAMRYGLSPGLALENLGKVSTAVTMSLTLLSAKKQYEAKAMY